MYRLKYSVCLLVNLTSLAETDWVHDAVPVLCPSFIHVFCLEDIEVRFIVVKTTE